MLKRVNFSGNPLGSPGVEILARVYIRSKLAYPTAFSGEGHDFSAGQSEDLTSDDHGPGVDSFFSLSIYDDGGTDPAHTGDKDPTPQPQGASEIASEQSKTLPQNSWTAISTGADTDRNPNVIHWRYPPSRYAVYAGIPRVPPLLSSEDEGGRLSTGNREKESEHHLAVE